MKFDKIRDTDDKWGVVCTKLIGNVMFYYTRYPAWRAAWYFGYWATIMVDWISDLAYFATSPFYSPKMAFACVFFWFLPILVFSSVSFCRCNGQHCSYKCAKFWMLFSDHYRVNRLPAHNAESFGLVWSLNWLFVVLLEDFPQMIL